MNCAPSFSRLAGTLGALTLGLGACIPIPAPHNEQVTPAVQGELRTSTGSLVPGAAIALTGSFHDTLCANAAILRVTDSNGRFVTPATEKRKSIFWFTLMESFGRKAYWLCLGHVDSAGVAVYSDRTSVAGDVAGDSLACLTWAWDGRMRVTCDSWPLAHNTWRQGRILTGGNWSEGSVHGRYRVILADVGAEGWRTQTFVQWLATSPRTGTDTVVAMIAVPGDVTLSESRGPVLIEHADRWYIDVAAAKRTAWNRVRWLTLELGAPGVASPVRHW